MMIEGCEIVLAQWGNKFVTWACDNNRGGELFWGHYYNTFEQAKEDFKRR